MYAGNGIGGDAGPGTMSFGCGRDGAVYSTVGVDKGLGEVVAERREEPELSQVGGANILGVGFGCKAEMVGLVAIEPASEGGGDKDIAGEGGGF